MGPNSMRLAWTMLAQTAEFYRPSHKALRDRGEAISLVVCAGPMAPRAATSCGSAARTEDDHLWSGGIAPGIGDTGQRPGHPRPISKTDDWGIGYG